MKPIIFKNKNEILDFANNTQYLGINLHNKIKDTLSRYSIVISVKDGIETNDMPFIQYSFTEKKLSIKKHTQLNRNNCLFQMVMRFYKIHGRHTLHSKDIYVLRLSTLCKLPNYMLTRRRLS